jgi:hypothetical protein
VEGALAAADTLSVPLSRSARGPDLVTPSVHFDVGGAAMEPLGRALGPADTRFNDFVGTVAADDAEAVRDRPSPKQSVWFGASRMITGRRDAEIRDGFGTGAYGARWVWSTGAAPRR